jgi:hypothetical protein
MMTKHDLLQYKNVSAEEQRSFDARPVGRALYLSRSRR